MIRFDGRDPFEFCVSSGALGFDGGGWWWERPLRWAGVIDPRAFVVVAKTVTALPGLGNLRHWHPWTCVRLLGGCGTTNAVGLTNPGFHAWLKRDLPRSRRMGINLAASVKPETPEEAHHMAVMLADERLPFVEVNLSCPNVAHPETMGVPQILSQIRWSDSPVVLKLSLDQVDPRFIDAVDPYVDAYHAINTVPWDILYPGKPSPIERSGHRLKGGVSGPAIRPIAVDAVRRLGGMTGKPIIGGGGIFSLNDVMEYRIAGAKAFSFGTCFLYHPSRPNQIASDYTRLFSGSRKFVHRT